MTSRDLIRVALSVGVCIALTAAVSGQEEAEAQAAVPTASFPDDFGSIQTVRELPDGRVLVVGGTDYSDTAGAKTPTPVLVAETWDPATESFIPAGSLSRSRTGHTATLLPDGRVLVVGGRFDGGLVASAEVWTP